MKSLPTFFIVLFGDKKIIVYKNYLDLYFFCLDYWVLLICLVTVQNGGKDKKISGLGEGFAWWNRRLGGNYAIYFYNRKSV